MSKRHKILIVDDDKDILELLKYNLEREGYDVFVENDSLKTLRRAKSVTPDLIILDIMMPELNGLEVCDQLRKVPDFMETYIFFLTAKSQKYLQLQAFEMGGDDYIEKITGLRALSHKVNSVLTKDLIIRKSVREIHINALYLDRVRQLASFKGREIPLSKYEFELLFFFAQNPRKEISRDNLLHNIWGSDVYLFAKSVDSYIQNICSKLGASLISKVREDKYRLNAMDIKPSGPVS